MGQTLQQIRNNMPNLPSPWENFEGEDIKEVSFNFFPSLIYMILITLCLNKSDFIETDLKNINQPNKVIGTYPFLRNYMKLMFVIYSLYLLKGIILFFIVKNGQKPVKGWKIFKSIFNFILDLSFFVATILGYYSFKLLTINYFIGHIYLCIFVFFLIFSGFTHLGLSVFDLLFIIFGFFWFMKSFIDNEEKFIADYGLGDYEQIASYLKQAKFGDKISNKYNEEWCSICMDEFKEREPISILGCEHIFHPDCIGKWLAVRGNCPVCKSTNIF